MGGWLKDWGEGSERWWWWSGGGGGVSGGRVGGGGGVFAASDRVLAVMEEKQTDLTVTNEPSPLPQLPVFTPLKLLPHLRSSSFLLPSFFLFHLQAFLYPPTLFIYF